MDKIDPKSGYNPRTRTFHSLRPALNLPPENLPSSAATYSLSLQSTSPWPDPVALIDSATGRRITYSEFGRRIKSLASYFQKVLKLSKGDVVFVLCNNSIKIPFLYFALLSIGVVISPGNPLSTDLEISSLFEITNPVVVFATSSTAHNICKTRYGTILIDSPEFDSMTNSIQEIDSVNVSQNDLAAILFSSGTTGKVKGVMVTHRNLIAMVNGFLVVEEKRKSPKVAIYPVPYFHMFGFLCSLKSVALSETVVVMERFDVTKMAKAVEEFRVTYLAMVPPIVVALIKSGATDDFD